MLCYRAEVAKNFRCCIDDTVRILRHGILSVHPYRFISKAVLYYLWLLQIVFSAMSLTDGISSQKAINVDESREIGRTSPDPLSQIRGYYLSSWISYYGYTGMSF